MRFLPLAALALGLLALAAPVRATADDATVPTYHADPTRSGHYVLPGLTWTRAATAHRDANFDGRVHGHVYAQPLYWHPPGAARGLIIVATESNAVEALDAATGAAVWRRVLGPPVQRAALPCGNIDPLGITGTPVIDPTTGTLYLDAMVDDGGPHHRVFGLSLRDGSVLPGWPLDVAAALRAAGKTFEPQLQGQRGALALVGDRLFVPFGGHLGDCGDYHGWVVGFHVPAPRLLGAWVTGAAKGGIWAPGGLSFDGHYLYAGTGNTADTRKWTGGEAVIRLSPDLQWHATRQDFFSPSNWLALDDEDADLGGTGPLPFDLPGANPSALLLALGKDGDAYLLNRDDLGGISRGMVVQHVADGPIITAPAAYRVGSAVMVAFQGFPAACPRGEVDAGLIALRISPGAPPGLRTAWCAGVDGRGAPIVTTADGTSDPIVWVTGAEGDDRLHGFRGDTGQPVFAGGGPADRMEGLRHFGTILAAAGRLYVAGDGRVYAFAFGLPAR